MLWALWYSRQVSVLDYNAQGLAFESYSNIPREVCTKEHMSTWSFVAEVSKAVMPATLLSYVPSVTELMSSSHASSTPYTGTGTRMEKNNNLHTMCLIECPSSRSNWCVFVIICFYSTRREIYTRRVPSLDLYHISYLTLVFSFFLW